MKRGYLSEYFEGIAAKRLSAVEVDPLRSHQHEFNGVDGLKQILGEPDGKISYDAKWLYFTDHDDEPITDESPLTWYDARQKAREERSVMRWEYRLYFKSTTVSFNAAEGDLLVIAKVRNQGLLVIVAENETNISSQIEWLFGISDLVHPGFSVRSELETEQDRVGFAARSILESIGIIVEETAENYLDDMLLKFNGKFPTTRLFSEYAQSTLNDLDPRDDPDAVLMAWMDREEILFRTLERHFIADRLARGFSGENQLDVDGFIEYSLSVQNRRKSRVGYALENHLEALFQCYSIKYSRAAVTENKSKPDFLFPGVSEYHNNLFDFNKLTMLGVKSTCKDRWRQVLAEADRIKAKHLLTLEAAISKNQTDEMISKNLQLVVPAPLHATYSQEQNKWLMNVRTFTELVIDRQKRSYG